MPWISLSTFGHKRASLLLATSVLISLILLADYYRLLPTYGHLETEAFISVEGKAVAHLPAEYIAVPEEQPFCAERFGTTYLENLHDSATQYCNGSSALTCFHSKTVDRWDSFCFGKGSKFDPKDGRFHLECDLHQHKKPDNAPDYPYPDHFHRYMYDTGPGVVFNGWVNLDGGNQGSPQETTNYSILVKREGATNHWHSLMEIFSMMLTMDVLQMTQPSKEHLAHYIPARDALNTQLIILDDKPDGPYFDMWSLFAKKRVVRLKDISENTTFENIIIPLSGGSNTLWQGDWEINSCEDSATLKAFANRVLALYGIRATNPRQSEKITFNFIDRVSGRRLVDMEEYLARLQEDFPLVQVQSIDFASMSYKEQLEIVQDTDILAGVHGAGLTHGIFLPPGSVMVEIMPPGLNHKGFRNVASLRGHEYFSSHASNAPSSEVGDWHSDDVFIEFGRFKELMDVAIKSLYNKGMRSHDAS